MVECGNNDISRGHPVQVVRVLEDNSLEFKEKALLDVLLRDNIKDLPVAVISIAGKYRQGKSFLLSFFLNYLQSQQNGNSGCDDTWLADENFELQGFEWKGGQERVTNGIMVWSEPFIVKTPKGKVAVVLMDTQGTDDIGAKNSSEVPIFALSTLLSSVLVFNVIKLARSDLENLRIFMDYGLMASKEGGQTSKKPFETLQLLVRDWNSPLTHPFGENGGAEFFKKLQKSPEGADLDLNAAFDKVSCFLMPHPGTKVDNDSFQGDLKDIEGIFINNIRKFTPLILNRNKLLFKKDLGGSVMTATDWCDIFREYINFFKDKKFPRPKDVFDAANAISYKKAFDLAVKYLDKASMELMDGYIPFLHREFKAIKESTRKVYNEAQKFRENGKLELQFYEKLQKTMSMKKILLTERNERNNEEEKRKLKEELQAQREEYSKLLERADAKTMLGKWLPKWGNKRNIEEEKQKLNEESNAQREENRKQRARADNDTLENGKNERNIEEEKQKINEESTAQREENRKQKARADNEERERTFLEEQERKKREQEGWKLMAPGVGLISAGCGAGAALAVGAVELAALSVASAAAAPIVGVALAVVGWKKMFRS